MGCDIHTCAQRRDEDGNWVEVRGGFVHDDWSSGATPWDGRHYGLFGWLAGVRNYSGVTPYSEPRGLPDDFDAEEHEAYGEKLHRQHLADTGEHDWNLSRSVGDHSFTWFTVDELLAVDYDQLVEDRRVTREIAPGLISGGVTGEPGEGQKMTLREFLPDYYFKDLEIMKKRGAARIIVGFDS